MTTKEFEQACSDLRQRYRRHGLEQHDWEAVEVVQHPDGAYVTITRALPVPRPTSYRLHDEADEDEIIEVDDDDEALHVVSGSLTRALIHYDIILSPVYRMPILYIHVSDSLHRYPPTMTTLQEHLIPPQFRAQTDGGGVLGGVSVNVSTESALCATLETHGCVQVHPVTDAPVFFIHPCQTAEVMQASVGKRHVTPEEYLLIWIGAMGKCVGLNVPLALM